VSDAVIRFRLVSFIVGVLLLVLAFVAMPVKYLAHDPDVVAVIAPAHGVAYMAYLAVCLDLARRARWSLQRTALVALAGAVPIASFVAERRLAHAAATSPESPR
jgi:integral membrane protein